MNPNTRQLIEEIIRLLEQLKRETEETRGYYQRNNVHDSLRNTNDNRDEMFRLAQRWDDLISQLNQERSN